MDDYTSTFRRKLPEQAEVCARKSLERLQKDLQGNQSFTPQEVFYLTSAAHLLLTIRDQYGEKRSV